VLSHADIHAHNTFQKRDAVKPVDEAVQALGRTVHFTFRPASVTKLNLTLQ
jgi:alpha-L-arabinofuranosidase